MTVCSNSKYEVTYEDGIFGCLGHKMVCKLKDIQFSLGEDFMIVISSDLEGPSTVKFYGLPDFKPFKGSFPIFPKPYECHKSPDLKHYIFHNYDKRIEIFTVKEGSVLHKELKIFSSIVSVKIIGSKLMVTSYGGNTSEYDL